VIAILDTDNMSFELEMGRSALRRLLAELDCPKSSTRLHDAGNDAKYTLRALILLEIKACEQERLDPLTVEDEILARIEALRSTAMTLLPGIKRPKKRKPRKKQLAKTRSLEEQEKVREERRQRRITTATIADLNFHPSYTSQMDNFRHWAFVGGWFVLCTTIQLPPKFQHTHPTISS
jgi:hypothetical protein